MRLSKTWVLAIILTAVVARAASKESEPPDAEMLRMMDFLKEMEMIKQLDMLQELHQVDGAGGTQAKNDRMRKPVQQKGTVK